MNVKTRIDVLEKRAQGIGAPRAKLWRILEQHNESDIMPEPGPGERFVVVELWRRGGTDDND